MAVAANDPKGYYEILGLQPGASIEEIKRAYNKLQAKFHPDSHFLRNKLNATPDPAKREALKKEYDEMSAKLNAAKSVLFDPEKKKQYDSGMGDFGQHFSGGADFFDIFSQFTGGRRSQQQMKVKDTVFEIKISFKEAYLGKSSKFKVTSNRICTKCKGNGAEETQTCNRCGGAGKIETQRRLGSFVTISESECTTCSGQGIMIKGKPCDQCNGKQYMQVKEIVEVDIKPGTKSGEKICYKGRGDEAKKCVPGNLVFVVKVQEDPKFERIGDDIVTNADIDLYTALVGGSVYFEHLDGRKLEVNIKPFTDLNACIVVHNEGFKGPGMRGHLYLKPKILINSYIDKNKLREVLAPILPKPSSSYGQAIRASGEFASLPTCEREYEQESEENQTRSFFSNFSFF